MGAFAATGVTTWAGGYDMTGDSNQVTLTAGYEDLDATTFGNTARVRAAGLQEVESTVEGFWQAGADTIDPAAFTNLGGLQVVTHTPTGTGGDVAYFFQAKTLSYEMFGEVGELIPFSLTAHGARGNGAGSVGAVRGRLLKAKGAASATGATGVSYELGPVAGGEYLYAAVHVFTAGTTITLVLESDDADTFASATTRATFGPLTTTGGTWATRVAGPITDTHYRFRVTAVTGTHTIAGVAGIK